MIAMDLFNKEIISSQNAQRFLSEEEYKIYAEFTEQEKVVLLKNLLQKPIKEFTVINELFFRWKWASLFQEIYQSNRVSLLEIASGDADMIPQSLGRSNPKSKYITANMNKQLNESMLKKTNMLDINLKLIDDDASEILNYIEPKSVDVIAFQHGVNDILQAIICDKHGVDTIYSDWMECLPKMIELLQEELDNKTFEITVKEPFLNLIKSMLTVLKSDGVIVINHYMFQLDLDWGYPEKLFENLILIIRAWFEELDCCKEVYFEGFDKQWWIFLKNR